MQEEFAHLLYQLKEVAQKDECQALLLLEPMHQVHNNENEYCWQIKGKANTARRRLNVIGAVHATNRTIEKASSGGTITFISNRVRTWVAGETTLVWSDDIYEITGSGSGKNANGINYTMNIVEPLVKEVYGCPYITKGKIEIQPQGKALRKLDFGSGTCDNDATVTINSKTYNIKLK